MSDLASLLKSHSCYVCCLRRTCAMRRASERLMDDFPDFMNTGGPSPHSWLWIPVAVARACVYFDFREEI